MVLAARRSATCGRRSTAASGARPSPCARLKLTFLSTSTLRLHCTMHRSRLLAAAKEVASTFMLSPLPCKQVCRGQCSPFLLTAAKEVAGTQCCLLFPASGFAEVNGRSHCSQFTLSHDACSYLPASAKEVASTFVLSPLPCKQVCHGYAHLVCSPLQRRLPAPSAVSSSLQVGLPRATVSFGVRRCKLGCRHNVPSPCHCMWTCIGYYFMDWFEVWYVAGGERHGLGLNP